MSVIEGYIPDLLDVQVRPYQEFLQLGVSPEKRERKGLEEIFQKVFPVESDDGLLSVEYLSYFLEEPMESITECVEKKITYEYRLKARFRLTVRQRVAETGELKIKNVREQDTTIGTIPCMTASGTFIINGIERVIVNQLLRCPGVYFKEEEPTAQRMLYSAKIFPARGLWIEFQVDQHNCLLMYLGRRKVLATTFLKALGYSPEEIISLFYPGPEEIPADSIIKNTLAKDAITTREEALKKIYSEMKPGYPPIPREAEKFFHTLFFTTENYDLSEAGRSQINKKLNLSSNSRCLQPEDIIATIRYLIGLIERREGTDDDIDHLGNKRVRVAAEVIGEHVYEGLVRLTRFCRERMTLVDKSGPLTIQDLLNSKVFNMVVNEFFYRNPLSQFLDQANPLAEITHKRRVTAVGEGGVKERKRAGFEVRDVHYTHFGKICPIETPEGANIGLINSLTIASRVDNLGFLQSPYYRVEKGRVSEQIVYLRADEEENFKIAPPDVPIDPETRMIKESIVTVRTRGGNFQEVPREEVQFVGVNPLQILSVSACLIPFLEHDDSNRALMGSNMQRQAVPLLRPETPLVKTGLERIVVRDSNVTVRAQAEGIVSYVDGARIVVRRKEEQIFPWLQEDTYFLANFRRTNQDTCFHQRPLVRVGQHVKKGQILTDGPCVSRSSDLALGRNLLVAFLPWHGYNYEDAIVLSERLVKEDAFTSIHIHEFEVEARVTELGPEEITADIPNVAEEHLKNLDRNGIVRVGAEVQPDDILVGKVSPRGESELTAEEKLLRVIFGEKAKDVQNTSLTVPPGIRGVVLGVRKYVRPDSDEAVKECLETRANQSPSQRENFSRLLKKKAADKGLNVNLSADPDTWKKLSEKTEDKDKLREIILGADIELKQEALRKTYSQKANIVRRVVAEKIKGFATRHSLVLNVTANPETWEKALARTPDAVRDELTKIIDIGKNELERLSREEKNEQAKLKKGVELSQDVICKVVVEVAVKKKVAVGDKMSGRHGNKGVVSRILAEEDMPFLSDGTPVDIILNPLGVPSRMNVGQILETHLGWALKALGYECESPVFQSITELEIKHRLAEAGLPESGKTILRDGQTGEPFSQPVSVGYIYMMKLIHLADEKIHSRCTGAYSLITQQPLGGRAHLGGQRFGEMEVWTLEGYGAAHTLREMLTVKSDDTEGRKKTYEAIAKGIDYRGENVPESFNVLRKELQGLGFDIKSETRRTSEGPREVVTIRIAPPMVIRSWSHGEVKKAETLNYRTYKPERDGLFCERIFGPVKDYECACGKYKKMRYKGIICDRCGVEVTTARVRRERMGHIELACPVAYVWLFKSTANWMGTILDISQSELEMVLYYERYIVIESNGTPLEEKQLLTEEEYHDALARFGSRFRASIGAEAIYELLKKIDLAREEENLKNQLRKRRRMDSAARRNLIKKLRMVQGLIKTQVKPEYMVTNIIPVIPPDLRPLLKLDGGRFVASDLNDLYQRVINRNNRLKKLLRLQAPDIIIRNEKRMLQEAVDALFDNGKHGNPVLGKGKRPLKSLSDSLRGKQGRFRQNLLGKRVDYSGRAVIVVGPELKLNECGVPKEMALELFGPFVLRELRKKEYFHTLTSAKRALTENRPEVWEILERVSKHHPVLLNRQPTLHRLSIQAFEPRLIEGNVLRIHPLVCPAYNADFDGDTMSIHVPLTVEAQMEAELLMKATTHVLSPASGRPIVTPTRDIVLGCYYLTYESIEDVYPRTVSGFDEALMLYHFGYLELHRPVKVRDETGKIITTTVGRIIFNSYLPAEMPYQNSLFNYKKLESLVSDIFRRCGYEKTVAFLDAIKELGFYYATMGGVTIGIDDLKIPPVKKQLVEEGWKETERVRKYYQDGIISEGERYNRIVDIWTSRCNEVSDAVIATLEDDVGVNPFRLNPILAMVDSGARGNRTQINQLMGMRGLMIRPTKKITGGIGEIIETPVVSSFREGMNVLEYFLSVHGGRKGLVDTALKTSDAGYLSRRLVDVAHAEIITEEDCGTLEGMLIGPLIEGDEELISLEERIVGRVALDNIVDIITDETIVQAGEVIDEEKARRICEAGIQRIKIRSVLTCRAEKGVCAKCYGWDLSRRKLVNIGESVGIVAAQSIGEPGTQLTLRTFHTGGTASRSIGPARIVVKSEGKVVLPPELKMVVNEEGHRILVGREGNIIIQDNRERELEKYTLRVGARIHVENGSSVKSGQVIAEWDPYSVPIIAETAGEVRYHDIILGKTAREELDSETGLRRVVIVEHKEDFDPQIRLVNKENKVIADYHIPVGAHLAVEEKQMVGPGTVLAKTARTVGRVQDITGGLPRVSELFEARTPKNPAILSEIDGVVQVQQEKGGRKVLVKGDVSTKEYTVPYGKHLLVADGDYVIAGSKLTDGPVILNDILRIQGEKKVQEYLLNEVQKVYRVEGVSINDKHIEIIVRRMLSRVRVEDPGDTFLLQGEEIDKVRIQKINESLPKGRKRATFQPLVLGITRVALSSEGFISAASFQETIKVLTNAAAMGAEDYLEGLKENVIMGKLIPAGTGFFSRQAAETETTMETGYAVSRQE